MSADQKPMVFDADKAWCEAARACPSPNFDARPANEVIDLLVIHSISLPPGEFGGGYVEQLFLNQLDNSEHPYFEKLAGLCVSAHFVIDRNGALTQYVSVRDRAWHAGDSNFGGRKNCNDFAIGVELEGCDVRQYADPQYHTLVPLTRALMRCFPAITHGRIVGHNDIAPARKTDPGPFFDWHRFRNEVEKPA